MTIQNQTTDQPVEPTPMTVANKPRDIRLHEWQMASLLQAQKKRADRRTEILLGIALGCLFIFTVWLVGGAPPSLTSDLYTKQKEK